MRRFRRQECLPLHTFFISPLTKAFSSGIIPFVVASVAHLVERHLAKVEVASSSLVTRSKKEGLTSGQAFFFGIPKLFLCSAEVNSACAKVFAPRRKHLYGAPAPPRLAGPHGMEMYLFGYISIFSYPENGPAQIELLPVKRTVKKYKVFPASSLYVLLAAFYAARYSSCFSIGVSTPRFRCTLLVL